MEIFVGTPTVPFVNRKNLFHVELLPFLDHFGMRSLARSTRKRSSTSPVAGLKLDELDGGASFCRTAPQDLEDSRHQHRRCWRATWDISIDGNNSVYWAYYRVATSENAATAPAGSHGNHESRRRDRFVGSFDGFGHVARDGPSHKQHIGMFR